jgi:hypothetical protein
MIQVIKATQSSQSFVTEHCEGAIVVYEMPYIGIARGYGEFMDLYKANSKAQWVMYQPHDVVLNYNDLLQAIKESPGAHFQLALSNQSHCSHRWLSRDNRTGWIPTRFVEEMAPIFRKDFYDIIEPFMKESKSSWGLGHLWAYLYKKHFKEDPWLCCDYEMHHTEEVSSTKWIIDGKTPVEELSRIHHEFINPWWEKDRLLM